MLLADDGVPSTRLRDLGLMPKQYQYISDTESDEVMYCGAAGAGKTYALCIRAAMKASTPGARVGVVRKTLVTLKATTLRTLIHGDGDTPPILQPDQYEYRKAEGVVSIHGGGEIVLVGCDDHLRLGSYQFSDIEIDEAIELDPEEYTMLLTRLRVSYTMPDGTPNKRQIGMATNPGSPLHFLYMRFYENRDPEGRALLGNRRVIDTCTAENYHLPGDYVQRVDYLTGPARDRYFLGLWIAVEGVVYSMFDTGVHIRHNAGPWDFYVAGVDVGFKHPMVLRLHGCRYASTASHVVSEFHASGTISTDFVELCQEVATNYSPVTFVVPPECADLIAQLKRANLETCKAVNDVLPGIRSVCAALAHDPPLLTMEPDCVSGNREYLTYRWKDHVIREEPIKEADDGVDADRYARMFIAAGMGGAPRRLGVIGRTPKEREDGHYYPRPEYEPDPNDERLWQT